MRNCPHCGKEIQDEAAFCRFCRQDVEPPLWLTSLQKCPYCAEWVERGIERCPLCGKVLVAESEEPFYISEEADSTERLLKEVRENIFSKEELEEAEDEPEPDAPPETPPEPPFHTVPRETPTYQEPSSDPFDSQEGLGVLRGRQREQIPQEAIEENESVEPSTPVRTSSINLPIGNILRWLAVIAFVAASIGGIVYVFREFDPLALLNIGLEPTAVGVTLIAPTQTPAQEPVASPTYVAATLPPIATSTGTPGECLLWIDIQASMEGQELCAYGEIKRRFRVDAEIPYMAIFSEEEGTFAIVDRLTFYTQFRPGDCIQVIGEVEIMRGVRPFIDANNNLSACPTGE